jgi:uncharacterized protein YjbI with pentapeptide repeats
MKLADAAKKLWSGGVPQIAQVPLAIAVLVILCWQHSSALGAALERAWGWYLIKDNREAVVPLATGAGGLIALIVAFGQFKTARLRHEEQTRADLQRRITESFSKAAEQLGSDKLEVRLGGIYTMERISKESPADYWTVMETLTAFVRERAQWKETVLDEESIFDPEKEGEKTRQIRCPTDIQAAMTVIRRRDEKSRKREGSMGWRIDLQGVDVRGTMLYAAHLEGADLRRAHLEGAILTEAHLEGAMLYAAHLEGADLSGAHLERAILYGARLEGANLYAAHLEGAILYEAHLERAILYEAHLERADLSEAHLERAILYEAHLERADLSDANFEDVEGADDSQMALARGNANTVLPKGIKRPAHWEQD